MRSTDGVGMASSASDELAYVRIKTGKRIVRMVRTSDSRCFAGSLTTLLLCNTSPGIDAGGVGRVHCITGGRFTGLLAAVALAFASPRCIMSTTRLRLKPSQREGP